MSVVIDRRQFAVERYCAWPGQAASYKVGQTRWLALREAARKRLGAKFDIHDFHDAGLTAAPTPLACWSA